MGLSFVGTAGTIQDGPRVVVPRPRAAPAAGSDRVSITRATFRALQGAGMAAGAPAGWLLIQWMRGGSPVVELTAHWGLYLYMLVGTMLVFGISGLRLGDREDRLMESNRELERLALTDSLTGLRNARYFHARLEEEHAEHERTGEPLAVAVLDLDHFKRINDEHGHQVGDQVLTTVAAAIASASREGETEARVGGEEFALLLPGSTGGAARDVAERVREAIAGAEPLTEDASLRTLRVTASAGVASTAELGPLTMQDLYRAADAALYTAKTEGRNRTVVAGDVDRSSAVGGLQASGVASW